MEPMHRVNLEMSRKVLQYKLLSHLPEEGSYPTAISGVGIHRFNSDSAPRPHIYKAMLVIIAQGRKWMRIGNDEYIYGEKQCFVSAINMPIASCMLGITKDKPYLALSMELDKGMIAELSSDLTRPEEQSRIGRGALVQDLTPDIMDAAIRLVELLDKSELLHLLAPMIKKEIHLHLLFGPFGRSLSSICTPNTQVAQIEQAIIWLKENYKEHIKVENLAHMVNMAVSTFHKHFKQMTTVSPLQYQKRLRMEEAQRLMLKDGHDVTRAALAVGYESQTQFSREYKKFFGESPQKDIARLRESACFANALQTL